MYYTSNISVFWHKPLCFIHIIVYLCFATWKNWFSTQFWMRHSLVRFSYGSMLCLHRATIFLSVREDVRVRPLKCELPGLHIFGAILTHRTRNSVAVLHWYIALDHQKTQLCVLGSVYTHYWPIPTVLWRPICIGAAQTTRSCRWLPYFFRQK